MDIDTHLEAIRREGATLAAAASRAGLDDPVPGCPGWDVRALARHLTEIPLPAASHVARRAVREGFSELEHLEAAWPDLAIFWPDDSWVIRANDWVSLPVPAVVGTAIIGSRAFAAFPMPQ